MVATVRCRLSQIELEVTGVPGLILKLGDPDSCRPRPHRDSHRKNVRRSNGIWESCSDTEHARMCQCLRRLVIFLLPGLCAHAAWHVLCHALVNRADALGGPAVGALCTVGKLARQASSSSTKMSEREPTLEIFSRPRLLSS